MSTLEEVRKRFEDEIREVDDVAQIVLKGHLVMDSLMTEAIETFFLHGEFVEAARLRVSQKIALCRAISTSNQNDKMWELVSSINAVRNALSHSLEADRRAKALQSLRNVYAREFKDLPNSVNGIPKSIENEMPADAALCLFAIAGVIGYLHSHLEEVRRLKSIIVTLDKAMNAGALHKSKA